MVTRALLIAGALGACAPELEDATSIVTEPRVLAARIEPAEAAPGASITVSALHASTDGVVATELDWAFCTARKGLAEPGPLAGACLVEGSDALAPIGSGLVATGTLPAAACRDFGPDAPDPLPGEPAGRPADPDGTGGFYQPIVARGNAVTLVGARVRCNLPGATPAQATEYRERYISNANPAIERVEQGDTRWVSLEEDASASQRVTAGAAIEFRVHWPACASAPCPGSEPYVWFDPSRRALVDRREAMRTAYFATAGAFSTGHGGRAESEASEPFTTGAWTAPAAAGTAHLWIVLRDDRGGLAWATYRIVVE